MVAGAVRRFARVDVRSVTCVACGTERPSALAGSTERPPCPNCGEIGIAVAGSLSDSLPVSDSPTLLLRHNLDLTWFRIAVEHEQEAWEARARTVAAAGSPARGDAIDEEMRSSIVAIAAAAFAIDAMFVKLEDLLEPGERLQVDGRVDRIVETLKVALRLGSRTQQWQSAIPRLFKLRREMVHFRGEATPGLPHPTGIANVSREAGTYTADEARRAVDLALEVLTVAHTAPRERHTALVDWAQRDAHIADYLEAVRRGDAT